MNCPVCNSLQPNDVTRCGSCGTAKDGNCVLQPTREEKLSTANIVRSIELENLMIDHRAGKVTDLIEATNEIFARYHAAIAKL